MSTRRFAILDPASGISGDMLLGALLDAGAPEAWLTALPARLGFPDARIGIERVLRCGISCLKVDVRLPGGGSEPPSAEFHAAHRHDDPVHPRSHDHAHPHPHRHSVDHPADHHHGDHRHLADLVAIVRRAPLSEWVRSRAVRAFELLCAEEGRIHGVSADAVALHEVGAVDAVIDIVGGIEGFEQLGVSEVYHRPLTLGSGWVHAAHGVMAVPTPVTLRLLEGIEIGPDGPVTGEATTPTGAVLLRVLGCGAPPPRWRAAASGWGAGGRDPEHYPNALRMVLAESVSEAGEIVTLSSDLDDLSPEYLEPLREALIGAGAIDVQIWGTMMKKGRPGYRIEALCIPPMVEAVTGALFLHSTTAGVRRVTSERVTLPRRQVQVSTADGFVVAVKVLESPGGPRVKAEFEDVRQAALRSGRPALEVAREIETAARAMVASAAAGGSHLLKEQG